MKRIGLVVAYDGTNYCGWQTQPNGITVQWLMIRRPPRSTLVPYSPLFRPHTTIGATAFHF